MKNEIVVHGKKVLGLQVTCQTGCMHYHSPLDIVAIKFKCCGHYYACYFCHEALAEHAVAQWESCEFAAHAILCGLCGSELTIYEYVSCSFKCVYCKARFNPGCKEHYGMYFG